MSSRAGGGKRQRIIQDLFDNPDKVWESPEPVSPSVVKQLKDAGLNVEVEMAIPRRESGLTYDKYNVKAYARAPETEFQMAKLRREESLRRYDANQVEIDIIEYEIQKIQKDLKSAQNKRNRLRTQRRRILGELDQDTFQLRRIEHRILAEKTASNYRPVKE